MASSFDNRLEQDGMCSVYSAQPSETNCSISEALANEITAVNEVPDDAAVKGDSSVYSDLESETNVSVSDGFRPLNQFDLSVRSIPKSETNVTMTEKFERCKDLQEVLDVSIYSAPPSETNVTFHDGMRAMSISEYTAPASEAGVTMADGFRPCPALRQLVAGQLATEYTAKSGATFSFFDTNSYVEQIQREHGISDNKLIGLQGSDGSVSKVIDSNECLLHLEHFQPIPVDFSSQMQSANTARSVESYLLGTAADASPIHHEI